MTQVQIPLSRIHRQDLPDPGPGKHLWNTLVAFHVSDDMMRQLAAGDVPALLLDHENILTVEGPGCYKCEEPFSKRLYYRKCTGSMELQ